MKYLVYLVTLVQFCAYHVKSEIASGSQLINKLYIKPVGVAPARRFVPLTEIPPPELPPQHVKSASMRRHLKDDCEEPKGYREVFGGAKVHIFGDYYEEKYYMTMATIIFPDHIDRKHFEVTTSPPYYTLKHTIPGIGFIMTTPAAQGACDLLYLDALGQTYSRESDDQSDESLEMARIPVEPQPIVSDYYSDLE